MSESLTFSSLLSKFAPADGASSGPNPSSASSSSNNKPNYSRLTAVGNSRPSSTTPQGSAARIASSPDSTKATTNGNSMRFKTENGSAMKKRKLDTLSEPLTETERQREERKRKLMETLKAKQAAAKGAPTPAKPVPARPAAAAAKPAPAKPSLQAQRPASKPETKPAETNPSALSYKERLALAAKLAEEKRTSNTIVHKARAPVVEKKEWQKRLEAKHQPKSNGASTIDRKSKSPGIGSSTATKKPLGKEIAKSTLARKGTTDPKTTAKGKAIDKSKPVEPVKRRRSPSPISWRGRNAPPPTKKPQRSRYGMSRSRGYEDEDEDDGWIVDDEDEDDVAARVFAKRYRYAESYEDSDSDMEARGADILAEEERSRRAALEEDKKEEEAERQRALAKAAQKKKLGKY